MKIKNKLISDKNKTFIIAEVGLSHEGSVGLAKSFIENIAKSGADAVKFQMHYPEFESSEFEKFRKNFSSQDKTRFDYWKRTSFTFDQWKQIKKYSEKKGLIFLCSPFSNKAVDYLIKLNIPAWKIASGEFNNSLMLNYILKKSKKPLILSTGLSPLTEIKKILYENKIKNNFCILQCNSSYPTSPDKIGHNLVKSFKKLFRCPVGISDHSGSLNSLKIAVAKNSNLIEAHVTFSRTFFGPDTSASITFDELKDLISFRDMFYEIENSNYSKNKLNRVQVKNKKLFSKSLILKKNLNRNDRILYEDLDVRKPLIGIASYDYKKILGKKLKNRKKAGEFLKLKDLK